MGAKGQLARHWEEEMLGEFLALHYPQARTLQRVRLGPHESAIPDATLSEVERKLIGAAWRRWADALIVEAGRLTIVEAAMIPDPGDTSRLQTYLKLLPVTPELAEFRGLPSRGLLVWGVDDPFSRKVAVEGGLDVTIFRPSNWLQFLSTKRAREQGAPRAAKVLLM